MNRRIIILLASAIFILALAFVSCSKSAFEKSKVRVFVDHPIKETVSMEISLDGKSIFKEETKPTGRMPPIIFDMTFELGGGEHLIEYSDTTRKIFEKRPFRAKDVKVIIIRTGKDPLQNRYIVLEKEEIPVK
jgi:hypothetical protein